MYRLFPMVRILFKVEEVQKLISSRSWYENMSPVGSFAGKYSDFHLNVLHKHSFCKQQLRCGMTVAKESLKKGCFCFLYVADKQPYVNVILIDYYSYSLMKIWYLSLKISFSSLSQARGYDSTLYNPVLTEGG